VLQILKYVTKYSSYLFIYLFIFILPPKKNTGCMHKLILIRILGFWSPERLDGWMILIRILGFLEFREAGWMDGGSSSGF
jgi:hypothetical protein